MPRHQLVISTENNHYLVWQAMLFHFSCMKHHGQPPIVVVHKQDEPLLSGFERIRDAGGVVQTAPTYRDRNGVHYPPRNTAGSLRHVVADADYLVLCDPDMFLLQPLPFADLTLEQRQVSFDFVGYLNPDAEVYQPMLDNVCHEIGFAPERLRQPLVDGGVPHVIPMAWQESLSSEWFEVMEQFPTIVPSPPDVGVPRKDWLATMWALVIAMHRLELEPVMTNLCVTNCQEDQSPPALVPQGPALMHYCYGGPGFNKRCFATSSGADTEVWNVPAEDDTVSGLIRRQLHEARDFYGLS